MMNRHYKTLELDKILHMLAEETSIDEAGELALLIEPQLTLDKVEPLLQQTEDAHMLIGRFGAPSFGGISNVTNPLRRAEAEDIPHLRLQLSPAVAADQEITVTGVFQHAEYQAGREGRVSAVQIEAANAAVQ